MSRMLFYLLFAGSFVVQSQEVAAHHPETGDDFLEHCDLVDEDDDLNFSGMDAGLAECATYVQDLRQRFASVSIRDVQACIPESVLVYDLMTVGVDWLERNPAEHPNSADASLARAFREAWPCR